MTRKKQTLSRLDEKSYPHKASLGDDYQYPIKGIGESSYKLESGTSMKMKEVLYVPGLKKNLLSISALDKKGYIVSFIDGKVLMWSKGKTLEDVVVMVKKEDCTNSKNIQRDPLSMRPLDQVNYGIGGLFTSTTNHYTM